MVVGGSPPVRVGRRQANVKRVAHCELLFFVLFLFEEHKGLFFDLFSTAAFSADGSWGLLL
ncbi:hypothetical protein NQ095_22330, partial [Rossellomorea sp. SC111]|uniref:hypothetical protein n=1 Tax=Rossellomorea sp. SC111 TaxID=2968985 RepID=UPI00215ADAD7